MAAFAGLDGARVISLEQSFRSPGRLWEAASLLIGSGGVDGPDSARTTHPYVPRTEAGEVVFWRCENRRAQAQAVAADIERLLAREAVAAGQVVVIVPDVGDDGRSVAASLEERAVAHRLVGEAAFFQNDYAPASSLLPVSNHSRRIFPETATSRRITHTLNHTSQTLGRNRTFLLGTE